MLDNLFSGLIENFVPYGDRVCTKSEEKPVESSRHSLARKSTAKRIKHDAKKGKLRNAPSMLCAANAMIEKSLAETYRRDKAKFNEQNNTHLNQISKAAGLADFVIPGASLGIKAAAKVATARQIVNHIPTASPLETLRRTVIFALPIAGTLAMPFVLPVILPPLLSATTVVALNVLAGLANE